MRAELYTQQNHFVLSVGSEAQPPANDDVFFNRAVRFSHRPLRRFRPRYVRTFRPTFVVSVSYKLTCGRGVIIVEVQEKNPSERHVGSQWSREQFFVPGLTKYVHRLALL